MAKKTGNACKEELYMKIRVVAAILFIALLFTACNVPNAEPSQSQTGSSGVSDSDPASKEESSQPSSEPSDRKSVV